MIRSVGPEDIGKWVGYNAGDKWEPDFELGKIKSYDEYRKLAFVVYCCDGRWGNDEWKEYTSVATLYDNLEWFEDDMTKKGTLERDIALAAAEAVGRKR